jgi:hypothetical protein
MSSARDRISESIDPARFPPSACTRRTGKEEAPQDDPRNPQERLILFDFS